MTLLKLHLLLMRNIVKNKAAKYKLLFIFFQFLVISHSFSQADINLKKYWVYRERLKNFMVSDVGTGTSIIAPKREIHQNGSTVLACGSCLIGWEL